MRTLRRARPTHFSSDLTLRALLRDRGDDPDGTFSSLTEEGGPATRRSLPEDLFDVEDPPQPPSSDSDFAALPPSSNMSQLSYSNLRAPPPPRPRSASPWHGDAQLAAALKHKSLGAGAARKYQDARQASLAVKHRSLDVLGSAAAVGGGGFADARGGGGTGSSGGGGGGSAGGPGSRPLPPPRASLRHRSLGRRERSAAHDGSLPPPSPQRSSLTPSFLEGLAERVRSASPTPASLSSNPDKIIASLPNARHSSLPSFSEGGSRLPSALGSDGQSVPSVRSNSSVFGLGSRIATRTVSQIGGSTDFDFASTRHHSSTSLRRVLSLGRSRADSDIQSVVSEPVVYADSAHIADDIWIAPKDLYSVERRVALKQFHKQKAAEKVRLEREAAEKEKARMEETIKIVESLKMKDGEPKEVGSSASTTQGTESPSEEFIEEELVDDDRTSVASARTTGTTKTTGTSKTTGTTRTTGTTKTGKNGVSDTIEAEVKSSRTDRSVKSDLLNYTSGPADMNHEESSLGKTEYNASKPDPFEYGARSDAQDMSSRLIRLFFSSGSQNPVPPSAKRAAEIRRQNGSSRSLFRSRKLDRSNGNVQYQNQSHSFRTMPNNLAGNMGMHHSKSTASSINGLYEPPQEPMLEKDFRAKIRDISKFANVRAWIRRRTYRRSQRRPERRPREAQT